MLNIRFVYNKSNLFYVLVRMKKGHSTYVTTTRAYSICLSDHSADVRGATFPALFDAERSRGHMKEQCGEALRTAVAISLVLKNMFIF